VTGGFCFNNLFIFQLVHMKKLEKKKSPSPYHPHPHSPKEKHIEMYTLKKTKKNSQFLWLTKKYCGKQKKTLPWPW
jgi:hypothetical protein